MKAPCAQESRAIDLRVPVPGTPHARRLLCSRTQSWRALAIMVCTQLREKLCRSSLWSGSPARGSALREPPPGFLSASWSPPAPSPQPGPLDGLPFVTSLTTTLWACPPAAPTAAPLARPTSQLPAGGGPRPSGPSDRGTDTSLTLEGQPAILSLSPTGHFAPSDTDAPCCLEPASEEAAVGAPVRLSSPNPWPPLSPTGPWGPGPSRLDGEQWTPRCKVRMEP